MGRFRKTGTLTPPWPLGRLGCHVHGIGERDRHQMSMRLVLNLDERAEVDLALAQLPSHHVPQGGNRGSPGSV